MKIILILILIALSLAGCASKLPEPRGINQTVKIEGVQNGWIKKGSSWHYGIPPREGEAPLRKLYNYFFQEEEIPEVEVVIIETKKEEEK